MNSTEKINIENIFLGKISEQLEDLKKEVKLLSRNLDIHLGSHNKKKQKMIIKIQGDLINEDYIEYLAEKINQQINGKK